MTDGDAAAIEYHNVTKRFGDITAVDDVSFEVKQGELLALLGPSGSGKTTTLRMLAGFETPTEGRITLAGRDVTTVPTHKRDTGMVFQDYALFPHMTVGENIAFGLKRKGYSGDEIDQRIGEVLEMVDLGGFRDRNPPELSGGQQQRVATGRAIVREPELFLFDEPLSNLDAKLRKHMRTELARLHTELGITTIYVTHDQEEAMTLADRIVILNDGKLQQVGSPKDVYYRPVNLFVADFIGSPSMNFFDVTLEDEGEAGRLVHEKGGFTYEVSPGFMEELRAGSDATEFVLGIRPEDLRFAAGVEEGKTISGTVEVVEVVGSDNFIYLDVGDEELRLRTTSEREPEIGSSVDVTFDETGIHLFDRQTDEAGSHGVGRTAEEQEAAVEQ